MASDQLVKVATFNAHHGADRIFANNRLLVEACRSLDADILGLQELDQGVIRSWFADQPALIARKLGQQRAVARTKQTPIGGWQCNALCARGPITDVDIVELPRQEGAERRVGLLARVELPAQVLSVACTHLQHRGQGAPEQLRALLDAFAVRPEPRVLLGDLNLGPKEAEPILAEYGYRPAESGPTVPASNPHRRIDWIAVAGPIEIIRVTVPVPLVSDHRPVVADLSSVEA